jgi:steroid delta-isomerase-like uncharacterized protein
MSTPLELAKLHALAEDNHSAPDTVAMFTDDCVWTFEAFGIELKGKEQIAAQYASTFAAFPDFRNVETIWYEAGNDVFVKALVEFTHDKDWNGIPASGKTIRIWALAHLPGAEDGLLRGEHVHLNGCEFLHKLGALPSANVFEVAAHIRDLERRVEELQAARAAPVERSTKSK